MLLLSTGRLCSLRACLHGGGGPQLGEVKYGGSPNLLCKRDQIKMRYYMDKRVNPPKRITSPTWGPPSPCKQALNLSLRRRLVSPIYCKLQQMTAVTFNHVDHVFSVTSNVWSDEACFTRRIKSITCKTVYGQVHNFNCPQWKKPGEKCLLEMTVNCALTKRSRRLGLLL